MTSIKILNIRPTPLWKFWASKWEVQVKVDGEQRTIHIYTVQKILTAVDAPMIAEYVRRKIMYGDEFRMMPKSEDRKAREDGLTQLWQKIAHVELGDSKQ